MRAGLLVGWLRALALFAILALPGLALAQLTSKDREIQLRMCEAELAEMERQNSEDYTLVHSLGGKLLWIKGVGALTRDEFSAVISEGVLSGELSIEAIPTLIKTVLVDTKLEKDSRLRSAERFGWFGHRAKTKECETIRESLTTCVFPASAIAEGVVVAAACPAPPPPPSDGPLAGTYRLEGNPANASTVSMKGTVVLQVLSDQAAGRALAAQNWGTAVHKACTSGNYFYKGTIVWDAASFFDRSFFYWTDGPSTILLCTPAADSFSATGNFRDSHDQHGALINWNGSIGGEIVPETVEGTSQPFVLTKQP